MVMPARLVPGIQQGHVLDAAQRHAGPVGEIEHDAEADRRPGDHLDIMEVERDGVFEEPADKGQRHGGDNDEEGKAGPGVQPPGGQFTQADDHRPDIPTKVDADS
jgi:hypothetical protein